MTDTVTAPPPRRHEPAAVLDVVALNRILPVLVVDEPSAAAPLGAALRAAELPCAEITLRTRSALSVLRTMATDPELVVGAGTVLTAQQAEQAIAAGASFVVTPGLNAAVLTVCREAGVPVIPGVATATEVQTALDAGITLVKLFPAEVVGGARLIAALAGPYPMMRFVPTGGISPKNLAAYLALPNVYAVGGTWIAPSDLLANSRFADITQRAANAVASVRAQHRVEGETA